MDRRDSQKSTCYSPKNQVPGEIAIYDSLDFIGHLVPKGTGFLAFTSRGEFLGLRTSSRIAAGLVYQAHRPSGDR